MDKPSAYAIKEHLRQYLQMFIPAKILDKVISLISFNSSFDDKKENILIDKDELEGILNERIIEQIPYKIPVKINNIYLTQKAVEDTKNEIHNVMDELVKQIINFSKKDLFENNEDIINFIKNYNNLDENIKNKIIENFNNLNRNIDKKILTSTEKIYKDPLTELFSSVFYNEFISDNIVLKRKSDIYLYNIFIDMLNKFKNKAVLYIDFANFKLLNEVVGHNEADKFLQNFGNYLKSKNVLSVRRGGDEFVVFGDINDLKNIQKEIISETFIKNFNDNPVLKQNKIHTIPVGGLQEIAFELKNSNSLDEINQIKKKISLLVKEAEEKAELEKINVKQRYNQPLNRKEAMLKIKDIEKNERRFNKLKHSF